MRQKKRKKFFLTLILALIFWIGWILFINFYPPNSNLWVFFLLLFFAVFLTTSLIFNNSRRGFFLSFFLILFLLFRYYKIATFLNIFLLLGFFLSLEVYFSQNS